MQMEESNRKNEILEAAAKRFWRYGLRKTALHEIAADVGLVKSALYKHFLDKEDLLKAVVFRELEKHHARSCWILNRSGDMRTTLKEHFVSILGSAMEEISELGISAEVWRELRPFILLCQQERQLGDSDVLKIFFRQAAQRGEVDCGNIDDTIMLIFLWFEPVLNMCVEGTLNLNKANGLLTSMVDLLVDGLRPRNQAAGPSDKGADAI